MELYNNLLDKYNELSKENRDLKHRLSNLEQLIIKMMCDGKAEYRLELDGLKKDFDAVKDQVGYRDGSCMYSPIFDTRVWRAPGLSNNFPFVI